jgi:protein phosphatase 1L
MVMEMIQDFKNVNKEYDTVVNANLKSDLLAVKDGRFKTVSWLGRIWRVITRQSFDDCKAVTVAKAIANLACHEKITHTQRKILKGKLQELKGRVRVENQKEIEKELARIDKQVLEDKELFSSRLEKNKHYAGVQQAAEKAHGFAVEAGDIPQSIKVGHTDRAIKGDSRRINGKEVGMACCQGKRPTMEDAEIAGHGTFKTPNNHEYSFEVFGVFDGHGGAGASAYVKENLMAYLQDSLQEHNLESLTDEGVFQALKQCFQKLGQDYQGPDGTTATVAMTLNGKVWVANVGDSRTILVNKNGITTQASEDAKPSMPRYKKTIEDLGGKVFSGRVGGVLAVGRAIGDKEVVGVSSSPKITVFPLEQFKRGFLVIACDGLYNVSSSNEVGAAVAKMAKDGEKVEGMSRRLVYQAIKNGSQDNVSAMVIKL